MVLGFLAAAWLLLWLGAHVWRITLNGNVRQTSPVLYNWLKENGIYYGMRKSEVDCEELSAALRNAFPDFSWVSATLQGTQLSIQVREGSFSAEDSKRRQMCRPALSLRNPGSLSRSMCEADVRS